MKKIPTLFVRTFDDRHRLTGITDEVTPGMEWVLEGGGTAMIKWDGTACAVINGELYKRYDAKKGKKPPEGAIPCCEPDPITGHWPHWVKVDPEKPEDKWFWSAFCGKNLRDGTYELVGPHFRSNPYHLVVDTLIEHDSAPVDVARSFEGIRDFLCEYPVEGLVFWKDGEPMCKIKRTDFGLSWPVEERGWYHG